MKRQTLLAAAIGAQLHDQPRPDSIGGDQGKFQRQPCGSCMHWKKVPEAGLGQGNCMEGPPVAFPIQAPTGQMGQILSRPMIEARTEGCDRHVAAPVTIAS
jgi:hypothetical protein